MCFFLFFFFLFFLFFCCFFFFCFFFVFLFCFFFFSFFLFFCLFVFFVFFCLFVVFFFNILARRPFCSMVQNHLYQLMIPVRQKARCEITRKLVKRLQGRRRLKILCKYIALKQPWEELGRGDGAKFYCK